MTFAPVIDLACRRAFGKTLYRDERLEHVIAEMMGSCERHANPNCSQCPEKKMSAYRDAEEIADECLTAAQSCESSDTYDALHNAASKLRELASDLDECQREREDAERRANEHEQEIVQWDELTPDDVWSVLERLGCTRGGYTLREALENLEWQIELTWNRANAAR